MAKIARKEEQTDTESNIMKVTTCSLWAPLHRWPSGHRGLSATCPTRCQPHRTTNNKHTNHKHINVKQVYTPKQVGTPRAEARMRQPQVVTEWCNFQRSCSGDAVKSVSLAINKFSSVTTSVNEVSSRPSRETPLASFGSDGIP